MRDEHFAQSTAYQLPHVCAACHGADKSIDFWRVRSADEANKKLKRRIKRVREKERAKSSKDSKAAAASTAAAAAESPDESSIVPIVSDEFEAMLPLRTTSKVVSFWCVPSTGLRDSISFARAFSRKCCSSSFAPAAALTGDGAGLDDFLHARRGKSRVDERLVLSLHNNALQVYDVRVRRRC